MLGRGLMQLVAYGAQDIYLTDNIEYRNPRKRYLKEEEIPLYDNKNYPYIFKLNLA